jgi:hypothetical protein
MRTYPGKAPKNGRLSYRLLAFPGPDGAAEDWDLYVLPGNARDAAWLNAKLVARTDGLAKGNYFLSWHTQQKRFGGRNPSHRVLAEHRPPLWDAVSYLLDLFAECFGIPLGGDALSALDLRVTDFGPDRDYAALCEAQGWVPLIGVAHRHTHLQPESPPDALPVGAVCAPIVSNRAHAPQLASVGLGAKNPPDPIGDPDEDLL